MTAVLEIPVDTTAAKGEKIVKGLQPLVRRDYIASALIDREINHTRTIRILKAPEEDQLKPIFDYGYYLKCVDDFHYTSWDEIHATYEEVLFLYGLIVFKKPRILLETHAGKGLLTLHLATAMKELKRGMLYSLEDHPEKVRHCFHMIDTNYLKEHTTVVGQESLRFLNQWDKPLDMAVLTFTKENLFREELELVLPHIKENGFVVTRGNSIYYDLLKGFKSIEFPIDMWVYQKDGSTVSKSKCKKPAGSRGA